MRNLLATNSYLLSCLFGVECCLELWSSSSYTFSSNSSSCNTWVSSSWL